MFFGSCSIIGNTRTLQFFFWMSSRLYFWVEYFIWREGVLKTKSEEMGDIRRCLYYWGRSGAMAFPEPFYSCWRSVKIWIIGNGKIRWLWLWDKFIMYNNFKQKKLFLGFSHSLQSILISHGKFMNINYFFSFSALSSPTFNLPNPQLPLFSYFLSFSSLIVLYFAFSNHFLPLPLFYLLSPHQWSLLTMKRPLWFCQVFQLVF